MIIAKSYALDLALTLMTVSGSILNDVPAAAAAAAVPE